MKKKKSYFIETIAWLDHWGSCSGWQSLKNTDSTPVLCLSTGYTVFEDKVGILQANSIDTQREHDLYICNVNYILKSAVVTRKQVK